MLLEERKEKLKAWFKDKHNLVFLIILLAAFIIRLYFFIQTYNQPVWWDEGEYLSMAKSFAYGIKFDFNPQRPPLYPALAAFLYLFNASEAVVRFLLALLPSLGLVIITYYLVKSLYNEKIALITASLIAFYWDILFNTTRFHTDNLALLFGLLSIFVFWKYYVKEKNSKIIWLSGVFLALGFMTRPSTALIGAAFFIYLLLTENYKIVLKKELWLILLGFLIALAPLVLWNLHQFSTPLAQTSGYVTPASLEQKSQHPITWNLFTIFPISLMPNNSYLGLILFVFFFIGLATFLNLILGFDIVLKNKSKELNQDLLLVLLLIIPFSYFLFIERPVYGFEPRWLLIPVFSAFLIISKGFSKLDELLNKHIKFSGAIITILLVISIIPQVTYANTIISEKKESYLQVKEAALWLKQHTSLGEQLYTQSATQTNYYSERYSRGMPGTYEEFVKEQEKNHARFFVVSMFEKHSEWTYTYPQQHPEEFTPVQVYMLNEQQPALMIYQYTPKSNPKITSEKNSTTQPINETTTALPETTTTTTSLLILENQSGSK
ncbi:MAG TPA: glycosyltransferase family 39 protein [Candidatus Nanoarchaeia archaeon]|nr:glycosyltransferase family 39 protein [Candidatus Nanoarchaeia archaeon]